MPNHVQQPFQRGLDRLSAHFGAVADKLPTHAEQPLAVTPGQPHGAHRFLRRTAIRTGHATHRHRITRPALHLGAPHHGLDHLAADRTHLAEQLLRHRQLLGLLRVGIGNVTGLEPGRAAGNPGNRFGDAAAGAGFGGTRLGASRLQPPPHFGRQTGQVLLIHAHLHSGVKACQGDTVH